MPIQENLGDWTIVTHEAVHKKGWRGFKRMVQDGLAPERSAIQTLDDVPINSEQAASRGKEKPTGR